MPDPGTALAIVSLTFQAVAGCIKGFVIVSEARNYGTDVAFLQTMVSYEEYRFLLWAKRSGLLADPPLLDERINSAVAKTLVEQLQVLLSSSTLKSRYDLNLILRDDQSEAESWPTATLNRSGRLLDSVLSTEEKRDVLFRAKLLQGRTSWPKRLWWAAVDKKKILALVHDIRTLIDGLWNLLSEAQQNENAILIRQLLATSIQISQDVEELRNLKTALEGHAAVTPAQGLIAAAAGLRATRLQLEANDYSSRTTHEDTATVTRDPAIKSQQRNEIVRPDLERKYFSDLIYRQEDAVLDERVGIACYNGELVYVELKPATARTKGPLRQRVQDLVAMLATPASHHFAALRTRGFFEDIDGFKIIYCYPVETPSAPTKNKHVSDSAKLMPQSLLQLMKSKLKPSLDSRLRLAVRICRTFLTFQIAGWSHKGLRSDNVLFFENADDHIASMPDEDILTRSFLGGFNFSRMSSANEFSEEIVGVASAFHLCQHPEYVTGTSRFEWYMDMYAMGIILIEIAEWWPLSKIIRDIHDVAKPNSSSSKVNIPEVVSRVREAVIHRFITRSNAAFRMGTKYARMVEICLSADGERMNQVQTTTQLNIALIALEESVATFD